MFPRNVRNVVVWLLLLEVDATRATNIIGHVAPSLSPSSPSSVLLWCMICMRDKRQHLCVCVCVFVSYQAVEIENKLLVFILTFPLLAHHWVVFSSVEVANKNNGNNNNRIGDGEKRVVFEIVSKIWLHGCEYTDCHMHGIPCDVHSGYVIRIEYEAMLLHD